MITSLVTKLRALPKDSEFRVTGTAALLRKMFNMGLVKSEASLEVAEGLAASTFARRRLPVVMFRLKMAETLKQAVTYVEQGQVRVGPEVVTDPAFLVSRTLEGEDGGGGGYERGSGRGLVVGLDDHSAHATLLSAHSYPLTPHSYPLTPHSYPPVPRCRLHHVGGQQQDQAGCGHIQ